MSYSISLFRKFLIASTIFLSFPTLHSADGGEQDEAGRYECSYCGREVYFATKKARTDHYKKNHADLAQGLFKQCPHCEKKFPQKTLCQHIKISHRDKEDEIFTHFCEQCGEGFPSPGALTSHQKKGVLRCDRRRIQNEKEELYQNILRNPPATAAPAAPPYVQPSSIRRFPCHKAGCTSSFGLRAARDKHHKVCAKGELVPIKEYKCPSCHNKVGKNIREHLQLKHPNLLYLRFDCSKCREIFESELDCNTHRNQAHNGQGTTIDMCTIPPLAPLEEENYDDDGVPAAAPLDESDDELDQDELDNQ